jgi:hypothetical protein
VLALIVSDAAAAVLGSIYGRTTYEVESDRRSIEGSVVFFLAIFLAIHLPLLLMTGIDRGVSVLLAVQVALVVTLLEGVSLKGCDNLTIPLASYYLLVRFSELPASTLVHHVGMLWATALLLGVLAHHSQILKTSGVMATTLFFYAVYTLGGAIWLGTPALALLWLAMLRSHRGGLGIVPKAEFQVIATFYGTAVAISVLIANDVVPKMPMVPDWANTPDIFFTLFIGATVGQLAVIAASQIKPFGPGSRTPPSLSITSGLCGLAVSTVGVGGLWIGGGLSLAAVVTVAVLSFTAALAYWAARSLPGWPAYPPWNMRLQTVCVALATALSIPVHVFLTAQ